MIHFLANLNVEASLMTIHQFNSAAISFSNNNRKKSFTHLQCISVIKIISLDFPLFICVCLCVLFFFLLSSTINRDSTASARSGKAFSENEIIESLPAESSERSNRLYDMAVNSFATFLDSHTMEVKFPQESSQEVARAIEEGRGKLKKVAGPLLLAFGAKLIALIPLFIGGLVFLAFKALVVSKIAFVLAALLGLQKFGSATGGFNLLGKVVNSGWGSGLPSSWAAGSLGSQYPYARTYENAQDMAYSAYSGEVPAEQQ